MSQGLRIRSLRRRAPDWGPALFAAAAIFSAWLFWELRVASEFIDESEVPVYGRLLLQGRRLYGDAWANHTHLEPMLASAVAWLWRDAPLAAYRGLTWLLQLLAALALARSAVFQRRASGWLAGALFLAVASVAVPRWFGHMALAYNFWGLLCVASLGAFGLPWLLGREPRILAAVLGGAATSLWLAGTPFTVFPLAGLLLAAGAAWPWAPRQGGKPFLVGFGLGALLQGLWLLAFADLSRVWLETVTFNSRYLAPMFGNIEPVGLGGRFGSIGKDLLAVLLEGRKFEVFILLAAPAAGLGAIAYLRRRGAGWARALLFGAGVIAFVLLLRNRGGHWRSTPWAFVSLALWCSLFGLALDQRKGAVALALGALLALVGLTTAWDLRPQVGLDSFRGRPVFDLAASWRASLPPAETVLFLPYEPGVYLLSHHAPGMDTLSIAPCYTDFEKDGGRSVNGTVCEQIAHYRPRYILVAPQAKILEFKWESFKPACLDPYLDQNYRQVPGPAGHELWERR